MDAPKLTTPPQGPGHIVWLASYPKSGNTWMRMVIGHLLGEANAGDDINSQLSDDGIASSRRDFDAVVGVDAAELAHEQVDCLRPRVYEQLSLKAARTLFIKTHDACLPTLAGEPLFPLAATRGVVHIVRNPLDVVVSLAHHAGMHLDDAVADLCDPDCAWCAKPDQLSDQLRQRLLDWGGHAASWLESPLPRLTVRYEDMLAQPLEMFAQVVAFCGLTCSMEALRAAVEASRFERLRELEEHQRFKETSKYASRFFREGRAGGWKKALTPEQAARILSSQGRMMARLGYASIGSGQEDGLRAEDMPSPLSLDLH